MKAGAILLASLLILVHAPSVREAGAATIAGKVFTAEDVDSVAQGAQVTLVFHAGPGGDMRRTETRTDAQGHYHFLELPSDTSLAYALQITFRGKSFLSNPIRFPFGEDQIDYNVLLTDQSRAPNRQETMVQGHPAPQSVLHTILIVLSVVVLFSLFANLARRREDVAGGGDLPFEARALIQEIASLDVRHEDGIIGEEEYRKVRSALMARLRSLSPKPTGSVG